MFTSLVVDVTSKCANQDMPFQLCHDSDNTCQLLYNCDLDSQEFMFSELPFAWDQFCQISSAQQEKSFNQRPAWSIVDGCFDQKDPDMLHRLMNQYANGLLYNRPELWEEADDKVLKAIARTYNANPKEVRKLYDIIATNNVVCSLTILDIPEVNLQIHHPNRYGFFLVFSRINHSCNPSARLILPIGMEIAPVKLITTRAVCKGESITIDYMSAVPPEQKRSQLWDQFGFICQCSECKTRCTLLSCNNKCKLVCACKQAYYCCKQHQKEDWKRHKLDKHTKK